MCPNFLCVTRKTNPEVFRPDDSFLRGLKIYVSCKVGMKTKAGQREIEEYAKLIQKHVPPKTWIKNTIRAFLVGGTLCAIGQIALSTLLLHRIPEKMAPAIVSSLMIVLGATLTALGFYDEIGRVGGMGAALPITGFANSIVSPAMEFKREGYVLGVSAKMFQVAGPVIVYGLLVAASVTLVKLLWA